MNNSSPLFSIVVPVYNSEKYLRRFLNSVIHQDFDDIEIILIDDGSLDSSGVICDHFTRIDSRIIVVHTPNSGICNTRNYGLALSKGKYLFFFDNDDHIQPHYFREIASLIGNNEYDIIECGYKYIQTNKNGNAIFEQDISNKDKCYDTNDQIKKHFVNAFGRSINPVWNKVYSANFLK